MSISIESSTITFRSTTAPPLGITAGPSTRACVRSLERSTEASYRWKGPFLEQGGKYLTDEDGRNIEPGDTGPGRGFERILLPKDLDTTALGPIVSKLKFEGRLSRMDTAASSAFNTLVKTGMGVDVQFIM